VISTTKILIDNLTVNLFNMYENNHRNCVVVFV